MIGAALRLSREQVLDERARVPPHLVAHGALHRHDAAARLPYSAPPRDHERHRPFARLLPVHVADEAFPREALAGDDGAVEEAAYRAITLNAADLAINSARLVGSEASGLITVQLDAAHETATFTFAKPIPKGHYDLEILYRGKIIDQANGLFGLDYTDTAGAKKRSLFTQFEPADARRMFPGWDEPSYKASFDLTLVIAPVVVLMR